MTTAFVTGPTGCIGAATVAYLLDHGIDQVVGMCRREDWSRIDSQYHDRIALVHADITNLDQVRRAVFDCNPRCIIHLAALQSPDCQAHPLQGMDVNVLGTANVFRVAAELAEESNRNLERFVFASSSAVYGPRSMYSGDYVYSTDPYLPGNLYGYWKVAGEGMAQAFHQQIGVSTVSLRLTTTYGPGRDQGLTSAPTTLLKAAARGESFLMPYQGKEHYHFVSDVGAGFGQCALEPFAGYGVFHLRGRTMEVSQFIGTVQQVAADIGLDGPLRIGIAEGAQPMPFVCELDEATTLAAFPKMPITSIESGIEQSLTRFRS